jgi:hypothetical protein
MKKAVECNVVRKHYLSRKTEENQRESHRLDGLWAEVMTETECLVAGCWQLFKILQQRPMNLAKMDRSFAKPREPINITLECAPPPPHTHTYTHTRSRSRARALANNLFILHLIYFCTSMIGKYRKFWYSTPNLLHLSSWPKVIIGIVFFSKYPWNTEQTLHNSRGCASLIAGMTCLSLSVVSLRSKQNTECVQDSLHATFVKVKVLRNVKQNTEAVYSFSLCKSSTATATEL